MLEREIEAVVCTYAKEKGFLVYKFTSPSRAGVPDRMFLAPHQRVFWIEFKREGQKLTPLQERECDKLADCGFEVYVCDSVEQGKAVIDEQSRIASMVFAAFIQVQAMTGDDESVH
jgi:hypothetical protein